MEIVLLENVPSLGSLGDVVNVKPGYARNFLFPKRIAKMASEKNKADVAARRVELDRIAKEKYQNALLLQERLLSMTFSVAKKVGADGKLFGSVTNQDLLDALKKLDSSFPLEKKDIRLKSGEIKHVGSYKVNIILHPELTALVSLQVVAAND